MCKKVDGLVGGKYLEQYTPDDDAYSDPEAFRRDIISLDKNVKVSSYIAGILFMVAVIWVDNNGDNFTSTRELVSVCYLVAVNIVLLFRSIRVGALMSFSSPSETFHRGLMQSYQVKLKYALSLVKDLICLTHWIISMTEIVIIKAGLVSCSRVRLCSCSEPLE